MKAHPILFSGAMVRALLDGSKTQTRRAVKFPSFTKEHWRDPGLGAGEYFKVACYGEDTIHRVRCPYGMAGDLLWVRETWAICERHIDLTKVYYKAHERHSHTEFHQLIETSKVGNLKPSWPKFKPSIHMPRALSRITLEITGVRVERLQDISEADCIAEGIIKSDDHQTLYRHYGGDKTYAENGYGLQRTVWVQPVPSYRSLWESINGAESWAANPWVWVIEFKVHQRNVDELLADRAAA